MKLQLSTFRQATFGLAVCLMLAFPSSYAQEEQQPTTGGPQPTVDAPVIAPKKTQPAPTPAPHSNSCRTRPFRPTWHQAALPYNRVPDIVSPHPPVSA